MSFLAFPLNVLPYIIITLIIAFTVHEYAHAFVAYKFGDPTAKNQGRLTLNPAAHLDPIGTIVLLIAGFGWARPVPVNRFHFKKPRLAGVLVSLAGPLSNLLLAFTGGLLLALTIGFGLEGTGGKFLYELCYWFTYLNVVLFVFNLLPLPPLDGYRIIQDVVSPGTRAKLSQFEMYGMLIFLVLIVVDPLYNITIGPVLQKIIPNIFYGILDFVGAFF
ncbi:site-2 protease family protein [Caldibacillus thermoamylovorans]|uniref:site-2 protease family protein n=1 Tax=Caldibacillus thermoamylovorans TaxID=35841 RepID=UPI001D07ACCE|nr:site-2 protease family protein [Caldibacillus thermoamylovorans]MCB5935136.1 site-2 protease family protein [Bacillus sp. DFI.2.34]MCB7076188.1 site-2 protease family protein [Caldibacillus thermoamylovorans]